MFIYDSLSQYFYKGELEMITQFLDWPVVTADDCFDTIRSFGISPWPRIEELQAIDHYLAQATDNEREEFRRFGPKTFLARHMNPKTNNQYLWDRNPEFGLEMCARDITYSVLRKLGKLKLV